MLYTILYPLSLLWTVIYVVSYILKRRGKRDRFAPPLHASPDLLHVVLKPFHLIIDTKIFNPAHDKFSVHLYKNTRIKDGLRSFYEIGNLFGALGMTAAIGLLGWTAFKLLIMTLYHPGGTLAKRAALPIEPDLPFHLIIPGITAPLGDLPLLLVALFLGQTTHELGHAISAALESVPLNSAGASLFVILPSAFVALSSSTLQRLRPIARLRIISAGAFHNLFVWGILVLLGWTGIAPAILSIGFKSTLAHGVAVVSVDDDSPLAFHIPVEALITKLNDLPLSQSENALDAWNHYFDGSSNIQTFNMGWCIQEQQFLSQGQECCSSDSPKNDTIACFSSAGATENNRCLNPVPILTDLKDSSRCSTRQPCDADSVCVKPSANEQLLRISYMYDGLKQLLLWSGPQMEVWQQVEVGDLLPRTFLSPIWLPRVLQDFFSYLKIMMLSLYLVNLLPLPFLDGDQLLVGLSELIFDRTIGVQDLESGFRTWSARGEVGPQRRKKFFKAGVRLTTWAVVVMSSSLSVLHWYQS